MEETVDPDKYPKFLHDSAGRFTTEEVLDTHKNTGVGVTTGLKDLRETSKDSQLTKLFVVEVVEEVDDGRKVEAKVKGAGLSSLGATVYEYDTGNRPTGTEPIESGDVNVETG